MADEGEFLAAPAAAAAVSEVGVVGRCSAIVSESLANRVVSVVGG